MKRETLIHIAPAYESHRGLIERVAREGVPPEATILFTGRNTIARVEAPGADLNIKAFGLPNVVNRYVYGHWRDSKARRSFANSERLTALGFKVPAPVAFIEETTAVSFHRSYFISEHLDGVRELRRPELLPFTADLLAALGREMARLHEAGVWMKDFSPGNILFVHRPDGGFDFYYVDLNRIAFDEHRASRLDMMWERIILRPDLLHLATDAYAEATGRPADLLLDKARRLLEAYKRRKKL